jgi:hypothetical protein
MPFSAKSCSTDGGTVEPNMLVPTQSREWLPIAPCSPNKNAPGYGNPKASDDEQGTLNCPLISIVSGMVSLPQVYGGLICWSIQSVHSGKGQCDNNQLISEKHRFKTA